MPRVALLCLTPDVVVSDVSLVVLKLQFPLLVYICSVTSALARLYACGVLRASAILLMTPCLSPTRRLTPTSCPIATAYTLPLMSIVPAIAYGMFAMVAVTVARRCVANDAGQLEWHSSIAAVLSYLVTTPLRRQQCLLASAVVVLFVALCAVNVLVMARTSTRLFKKGRVSTR